MFTWRSFSLDIKASKPMLVHLHSKLYPSAIYIKVTAKIWGSFLEKLRSLLTSPADYMIISRAVYMSIFVKCNIIDVGKKKISYACACACVASDKQSTLEGCFGTPWETQGTDLSNEYNLKKKTSAKNSNRNSNSRSLYKCRTERFKSSFFPSAIVRANSKTHL